MAKKKSKKNTQKKEQKKENKLIKMVRGDKEIDVHPSMVDEYKKGDYKVAE